MSRYPLFDRSALELRQVGERGHDLLWQGVRPLKEQVEPFIASGFSELIERISMARRNGRPVILFMGGHPIKLGLSRYLVDLIERRLVTHLATNGAGLIHDFELAFVGGTSEDVAKWIKAGQFGLWQETSRLNEIVIQAVEKGEGLGEAIGRVIEEERFPHRDLSIAAAGWRSGVPVTSHVTIGGDIIHAMLNCDGGALGKASYTDFLIFTRSIQDLEGGVFLNVGSAVTGPEVYLKALSMVRNIARQHRQEIRHFTSAVFDLVPLPDDWYLGTPRNEDPLYYYRPWKTILIRTVHDGGTSYYFCSDHRRTIPALWQAVVRATGEHIGTGSASAT
jgi:hypothetical protein